MNREFRTQGGDNTDFINCVCFGAPAKNAERYLKKGMLIAVRGWIRTGSYTGKDGKKVYTTDVQVDRAEFAESRKASEERLAAEENGEHVPMHTIDKDKESVSRREPEIKYASEEEDFVNIPDDFDEDNIPFT